MVANVRGCEGHFFMLSSIWNQRSLVLVVLFFFYGRTFFSSTRGNGRSSAPGYALRSEKEKNDGVRKIFEVRQDLCNAPPPTLVR